MIIHRLTIRNYRGVEEASVEFSPVGITIIEGDNEVGKSSLMEALHYIFEYTDDSGHRHIKATRPTHRDKGPEIELEAETGSYQFRYFKRYHRKPATELTVTAPGPENHTGRQAHERAEEILNETIDRPLWKAVGVQQGEGISQANLKNAGSLTAALNRAAGGDVAVSEESTLFDDIEKEYRKYYTGGRKETKEIKSARNAEEELEKQLTVLQQQILEVEMDAERAATLKEDIRKLEETNSTLKMEASDSRENLTKVENLEEKIGTHELELGNLVRDHSTAERDLDDRNIIIQRIVDSKEKIEGLSGKLGEMEKELGEEESAVSEAKGQLDSANDTLKAAKAVRDLRQKDHDYYRNLLFLEQMEERKLRIDSARDKAKGAGVILGKIRVTDDILSEILGIERKRDSAIARLEVGAPSLILNPLKDVDLKVDGNKVKLKSGEEEIKIVTDEMSVLVPGVLEIRVAPGVSSEGLSRQLGEAEEKLASLLEKNGVKDSTDAGKQLRTREKAESQIEDLKKIEGDNLRDLTYEELSGRIEGLREVTVGYLENRVDTPQIAEDRDFAQNVQQEAEEILEKAEQDHEKADKSQRTTEEARNTLREKVAETKGHAGKLAKDLEDFEKDLKAAREDISDKALEEKVTEVKRIAGEKRGIIGLKREELAGLNPEQVRALVETTKGSLASADKRLRKLELEQAGLESRLRTLGEEGLHEKIQKLEGDLFRSQRYNRSSLRRADAAKLLYITMKEKRDEAFESYKAPFKDKIEQLGRLVHNDSFQVLLNDDLSIEERVLNGIKVPFESLSGGAKEQVSMLARIAAAILVSEDNAVPIIIDDALGNTSPKRLKYMGAVIAQAGKTGQVIVLTCTPERYAHLGKVKSVSLD